MSKHGAAAAISEIQSSPQPVTSEKVTTDPFPDISMLVGTQDCTPQGGVMPDLSQIPEIVPEGLTDISQENFMETDNEFLDPASLGMNGSIPIEIDNISPDPDIDALLDNSTFWDDLLMQSPLSEDFSPNGTSNGLEAQPKENGWDKQHMDKLTEQMGLLASETEGV